MTVDSNFICIILVVVKYEIKQSSKLTANHQKPPTRLTNTHTQTQAGKRTHFCLLIQQRKEITFLSSVLFFPSDIHKHPLDICNQEIKALTQKTT